MPFSTDFAQSCNTAFVSLADRLQRDDLPSVAREFGLGEKLETGVPVADADVPAARDDVGQAAMMIGQDRILASPLAMAGVAATVAEGRWRAPRVLADAPKRSGERLPEGMLATLRTLMRSVITSGTGTALADLPGEVRGKSGTAEYGGGDPPPTHAWFIATRGDLALAVLVEDGESGGRVAAPVARRFFEALRDSARRAGFAAALVIDVPDDVPGGLDDASKKTHEYLLPVHLEPNNVIRVGVVGLGYWGPNLARNFAAIPNASSPGAATARRRPASAGRRPSRAPASRPNSRTSWATRSSTRSCWPRRSRPTGRWRSGSCAPASTASSRSRSPTTSPTPSAPSRRRGRPTGS